jgi:hypothetical protein
MSKSAIPLARVRRFRRPALLRSSVLVLGSTLVLGLVLAGCAGSGRHAGDAPAGSSRSPHPSGADPTESSGSAPNVPCSQWSCAPEQPEPLGGGYAVRLWSSAAPTGVPSPDLSTPVVQLLQDGQHRQWWVGRTGFGWSAKLTCLPAKGAIPAQCAVLAEVGSHAGSAEVMVLRSGALVSSPQASVTFDGGRPLAADFDHDGWLDVLGTENDYKPNYATGHNYWASYRFTDGGLQRTGCAPRRTQAEPPPDRLLTGTCPAIFAS